MVEIFYQKEASPYIPDFIETVEVEKKGNGYQKQIISNKKATLIYLANLGTISFHIWAK
jgi:bifunctional non-homologous end joining protein LigD